VATLVGDPGGARRLSAEISLWRGRQGLEECGYTLPVTKPSASVGTCILSKNTEALGGPRGDLQDLATGLARTVGQRLATEKGFSRVSVIVKRKPDAL